MGGVASSGSQVQDRYFLTKVKLGEGSFGVVWRAVDRQTDTVVAVKQLSRGSPACRREDVDREIAMLRAARHENIARFIDFFEDSQYLYLALEYCEGGDFGDKIKQKGSGIQEHEAQAWMRQMISAIHCMHSKGICHCDVKPDNFLVSGEGSLKLSDFGLAKFVPAGSVLRLKCGTPVFMAPELHHLPRRSPGYSFPVDIWAAGVSMYMVLLGGQHPFIDSAGRVDHDRMLQGTMDFRRHKVLLGKEQGSEEARYVCRSMVQPDFNKRVNAVHALSMPWLGGAPGGMARTGPPPIRAVSPAPASGRRPATTPLTPFTPLTPLTPLTPTTPTPPALGGPGWKRDSPRSKADAGYCRNGCGCRVAPGTTKANTPFKTCCKGCAHGRAHDRECRDGFEEKLSCMEVKDIVAKVLAP